MIENGIRYGRRAVASRKRSLITDACAIANASVAPNANVPARKSRSEVSTSPNASTPHTLIATHGVDRRGCSRPIALGIWRFVASEYASRETPIMFAVVAWTSTTAATAPMT